MTEIQNDVFESLQKRTASARASMNVLFDSADAVSDSKAIQSRCDAEFLEKLSYALEKTDAFLPGLQSAPTLAECLYEVSRGKPDVIDALNLLSSGADDFRRRLEDQIFQSVSVRAGSGDVSLMREIDDPASRSGYLFTHAVQLAKSLETLLPDFIDVMEKCAGEAKDAASRLDPSAKKLSMKGSSLLRLSPKAAGIELGKRVRESDIFHSGRAFRYFNGKFSAVQLNSIRPVKDFYGYASARRAFADHFGAFAEGKENLPMLITSLPGLGKTHMTIAHCLHYENITLILPEPEDLQRGLELLIRELAARPERRFMIFFDDIDTRSIDWYYFRTNVGGAFALPPNTAITIASNWQFPANISSRGKSFVFPTFDEIRCQEMVEDFLNSRGMENVRQELVSVIAADYVEEFGQKIFDELSPRTLVRYLESYLVDSAKRRKMLELSKGDVLTRPDSQVFYEMNVKMLRALYGDEAMEELRRRQLNVS